MRAVPLVVLCALLVPAVLPLVAADGVAYEFTGRVTLVEHGTLPFPCSTTAADLRLDILTPLRANTPAGGGVAVLLVEGGRCADVNETLVATPMPGGAWSLRDPVLGGSGVVQRDGTANGTYAVSLVVKAPLQPQNVWTEIRATKGVELDVLGNV